MVAGEGFDERTRRLGSELPVEGSLTGLSVTTQRLMLCTDIANDPRLEPNVRASLLDQNAQFVTSVPLVFRGQALGALNTISHAREKVDLRFLDTMRAIGQTVSLAIANARHLMGLEHQAFHDPLTGLANRSQLHRHFRDLVAASEAEVAQNLALILFDLDHFKEVNDALGHRVGDILLRRIGVRMERAVDPAEALVCRLGGDEFAVLVDGVTGADQAESVALKMLFEISRPVDVDGMSLQVGASAGIAIAPEHGDNSHELLRCADVAMYRAKRTTSRIAVYAAADDRHTPERLALMGDLGKAIDNGDLALQFQPKIELESLRLVGFEALLRWHHPRLGQLLPDDFIPLAELGDVIHPLTGWVVDAAVEQLHRWLEIRPELTLAVNLSTRNLLDRRCASMIEQIVSRYEVPPSRLEVELTETALLNDPDLAGATLDRLDDLGVRLAIDDFGTGYSSLSLLQRFRIDTLKIDRSFVVDICSDETSTAIVRSVVGLAHGLGLDVVGEGVESLPVFESLRDLGCDLGQGFFISEPAPAAAFTDLVKSGHWKA
jgi:diguanylate cyclase (GGDEF)-like protein